MLSRKYWAQIPNSEGPVNSRTQLRWRRQKWNIPPCFFFDTGWKRSFGFLFTLDAFRPRGQQLSQMWEGSNQPTAAFNGPACRETPDDHYEGCTPHTETVGGVGDLSQHVSKYAEVLALWAIFRDTRLRMVSPATNLPLNILENNFPPYAHVKQESHRGRDGYSSLLPSSRRHICGTQMSNCE